MFSVSVLFRGPAVNPAAFPGPEQNGEETAQVPAEPGSASWALGRRPQGWARWDLALLLPRTCFAPRCSRGWLRARRGLRPPGWLAGGPPENGSLAALCWGRAGASPEEVAPGASPGRRGAGQGAGGKRAAPRALGRADPIRLPHPPLPQPGLPPQPWPPSWSRRAGRPGPGPGSVSATSSSVSGAGLGSAHAGGWGR